MHVYLNRNIFIKYSLLCINISIIIYERYLWEYINICYLYNTPTINNISKRIL